MSKQLQLFNGKRLVAEPTYADRSSYYQDIHSKGDIIGLFREGLERAGYRVEEESQMINCTFVTPWDYEWHHVRLATNVDCHLWHRVMFELMGKQWVPTGCQNCYKVVIKPRTLKELFATLDLQKRLNMPSKCGIETRPSVFGNYGGYWYNTGLDEGLKCYSKVKAAALADPLLKDLIGLADEDGCPTKLILKRGCTEFEHKLGASDRWESSPEQQKLEGRIANVFVRRVPRKLQPEYILEHIHSKWIEFAWDRGDPTVFEFTQKPIYPPYIVYHHLAEQLEREGRL